MRILAKAGITRKARQLRGAQKAARQLFIETIIIEFFKTKMCWSADEMRILTGDEHHSVLALPSLRHSVLALPSFHGRMKNPHLKKSHTHTTVFSCAELFGRVEKFRVARLAQSLGKHWFLSERSSARALIQMTSSRTRLGGGAAGLTLADELKAGVKRLRARVHLDPTDAR